MPNEIVLPGLWLRAPGVDVRFDPREHFSKVTDRPAIVVVIGSFRDVELFLDGISDQVTYDATPPVTVAKILVDNYRGRVWAQNLIRTSSTRGIMAVIGVTHRQTRVFDLSVASVMIRL